MLAVLVAPLAWRLIMVLFWWCVNDVPVKLCSSSTNVASPDIFPAPALCCRRESLRMRLTLHVFGLVLFGPETDLFPCLCTSFSATLAQSTVLFCEGVLWRLQNLVRNSRSDTTVVGRPSIKPVRLATWDTICMLWFPGLLCLYKACVTPPTTSWCLAEISKIQHFFFF